MRLPICAHIGGGKVKAVFFQNQQAEDGVGDIVVHRHAVYSVPGIGRPPVGIVLHPPRALHRRPIMPRRKFHPRVFRQLFHTGDGPTLHRHSQSTSRKAAQHRAAHALLEIGDLPYRTVPTGAQRPDGRIIVRLPCLEHRIGDQPRHGALRLGQRQGQLFPNGRHFFTASVFRLEKPPFRQGVEPGIQRPKVHIVRFCLFMIHPYASFLFTDRLVSGIV